MRTTSDERRHHPARGSAVAAASLALGLGVTGCAADLHHVATATATTATTTSARGASTVTAAAAPTATTGLERDIVLAGRHFRARCDGSGPAVIAVADYGRSMDDTGPYLHDLAPHAQVCLYDRLGVGRSDSRGIRKASFPWPMTSKASSLGWGSPAPSSCSVTSSARPSRSPGRAGTRRTHGRSYSSSRSLLASWAPTGRWPVCCLPRTQATSS